MRITLNPSRIDDYRAFLRIKSLPVYRFRGREAWFPDEYASQVGLIGESTVDAPIELHPDLFDYQAGIARLAIRKRKFAAFVRCGLGKTLIFLEFARHASKCIGNRKVLMVSPLMVIDQTISECQRFYGDSIRLERIASGDVSKWLAEPGRAIGITNYEAFRNEISPGYLGALILDESSTLKSHYGKYAQAAIQLGRGLEWKLAGTGTPAPNDRIEYANHAVFLDHFPTVNSFLAKYFVNRGQTQERWELKPHALRPFYLSLSHWGFFLTNPSVYGWKDNAEPLPPIRLHVAHVDLTDEQRDLAIEGTGQLVPTPGGIANRGKLARIAKGSHKGKAIDTYKPAWIVHAIESWRKDESTIVWCKYNDEQDRLAALMPEAGNIDGRTPYEDRMRIIDDFQAGRIREVISKPDILGFGLNLQRCTRMVFSTAQDSYEDWHQCIARANRHGATKPLDVHVPLTELEAPMFETILAKVRRIEEDTEAQEQLFRETMQGGFLDVA